MKESNEQIGVNDWSKLSFDELEKMESQNEEGLTNEQRERITKAKERIIGLISEIRPETILDIGTGRGSFVRSLIENLDYEPRIVCLDKSRHILEYLRNKLKNSLKVNEINFIPGEIVDLPFEDSSFAMVTSFGALGNMNPDQVPKGLNEIYRVLKKKGIFIDFNTVFEEGSKSAEKIREIWGMGRNNERKTYAVYKDVVELYKNSSFEDVDFEFTEERIEDSPNPNDLVPVRGDWFADIITKARKAKNWQGH